jgi:hypothetical protein
MGSVDWEKFGEWIVGEVLDALDEFCEHYAEDPLSCYKAYASYSLYELADVFALRSRITLEDLELLREMPRDVYERYDKLLHDVLRDTIEYIETEERRSRELRRRETAQGL